MASGQAQRLMQQARLRLGLIMGAQLLATALVGPAVAAELKVMVTDVRSSDGAMLVGLYDAEHKFDNAIAKSSHIGALSDPERYVGVSMRAHPGTVAICFPQLAPRRYAVIVFHDENDNGRLDKGIFGLPKEGHAFANNAVGFLGPPSFEAASVLVADRDVRITIRLRYD